MQGDEPTFLGIPQDGVAGIASISPSISSPLQWLSTMSTFRLTVTGNIIMSSRTLPLVRHWLECRSTGSLPYADADWRRHTLRQLQKDRPLRPRRDRHVQG
jgi:hypothetical protein